MVVDTSVFIEYLRAKDKKKSILIAIPDSTQLFISSVTMYELCLTAFLLPFCASIFVNTKNQYS